MAIVDPKTYVRDRSLEAVIVVPSRKEKESARLALANLFTLFYACPLFKTLQNRQKRRFIRTWISKSIQVINADGFIPSLIAWSKLGNTFLRCFRVDQDSFTYEVHPDLACSPIQTAIWSLQKIDKSDPLFIEVLDWVYNWHVYLAKTPLTRDDLEDSAEAAWVDRQSQVKDINLVSIDTLEALRSAMWFLLDSYQPEHVLGKHGPGSTASGAKTVPEKERAMYPTIQTVELDPRATSLVPYVIRDTMPDNVLTNVFKDLKSLRPITQEDASVQRAQQAISRYIYSEVDSGKYNVSKHVSFSHQEYSQKGALRGSCIGRSRLREATIDLESGSDFMSVELVAAIFPSSIVHHLMCGRSWRTRTAKHGSVELGMYGGMGSALTFPVQTFVFTALCYVAVARALYAREYGGSSPGVDRGALRAVHEFVTTDLHNRTEWSSFSPIRVFGDDIILPEFAVSYLLQLLEEVGLRVNTTKSFYGDLVAREACGIYAFAGVDITPVRYRIPPMRRLTDYATYEALRTSCNRAYYAGYNQLYRSLLHEIVNLKPFTSSKERDKSRQNIAGKLKFRSTVSHTNFGVLFEPPKGGPEEHIGVVSSRGFGTSDLQLVHGELNYVRSYWIGRQLTSTDTSSEEYHYDQALFDLLERQNREDEHVNAVLTDSDLPAKSHGKIPDGIRLVKRAAYRREIGDDMGWAWVSS